VEDEPLARKGLEEYIAQIQFIDLITTFKNALEAIPFLNGHQVDLIFLDINMPKITGIQLVQSLQTVPMVIFTTAYTEYAVQGYELNAIDYLVKPIPFERFLKACNKALEYQQFLQFNAKSPSSVRKDHFFIKADGKIIKISIDEIL
jgi:DNA-binding LytR/AlgR family response regulator